MSQQAQFSAHPPADCGGWQPSSPSSQPVWEATMGKPELHSPALAHPTTARLAAGSLVQTEPMAQFTHIYTPGPLASQ